MKETVDEIAPYGVNDRVNDILNASGVVGLALLDMPQFGATFGTPKSPP